MHGRLISPQGKSDAATKAVDCHRGFSDGTNGEIPLVERHEEDFGELLWREDRFEIPLEGVTLSANLCRRGPGRHLVLRLLQC